MLQKPCKNFKKAVLTFHFNSRPTNFIALPYENSAINPIFSRKFIRGYSIQVYVSIIRALFLEQNFEQIVNSAWYKSRITENSALNQHWRCIEMLREQLPSQTLEMNTRSKCWLEKIKIISSVIFIPLYISTKSCGVLFVKPSLLFGLWFIHRTKKAWIILK